eukprot:7391753-Prymnesium_polylepis.2
MRDPRPPPLLVQWRDGQLSTLCQLCRQLIQRLTECKRHRLSERSEGVATMCACILFGRTPIALDPIKLAVVLGEEEREHSTVNGEPTLQWAAHLDLVILTEERPCEQYRLLDKLLERRRLVAEVRLRREQPLAAAVVVEVPGEPAMEERPPAPAQPGRWQRVIANVTRLAIEQLRAVAARTAAVTSATHWPKHTTSRLLRPCVALRPAGGRRPRCARITSAPLWRPQSTGGTGSPAANDRAAAVAAPPPVASRTLRTKCSLLSSETAEAHSPSASRRSAGRSSPGLRFLRVWLRPVKYLLKAASSSAAVGGASVSVVGCGGGPTSICSASLTAIVSSSSPASSSNSTTTLSSPTVSQMRPLKEVPDGSVYITSRSTSWSATILGGAVAAVPAAFGSMWEGQLRLTGSRSPGSN